MTAWRKPRKLGDKLRYRITTEESASSLALANDDSADAAEESVEEMFEGSDDADFFLTAASFAPRIDLDLEF